MSPTAVTPDQFSTFGELLRHLRRQARITQRELAIAVGYSDTQISRIEQNQRVPDSATLTALFVPALYLEDEPKWVARLLELAKAGHVDSVSGMEPMAAMPTGTVTFLFTDIEGSTKLARQYPDAMPALLARHYEILNQCIQAHTGYAFQIVGDSLCAAFHSASEALHAALAAQRLFHNEAWSPAPIKVRMGIHTGKAQLQDASQVLRYSGYATLSLAQRIMAAGHGGQILVSGATEYLLHDGLPNEVTLRDLGEHNFKDVRQPVRVFQVVAAELQEDFPALRTFEVLPHNLPVQLTSFIGREKELADVKKLLRDAPMLMLLGPGGTGKTRLSIQAASEALDQYPNGVWLVELAPILEPLLVPRTTAIAIGLRDEPQRPVIDMLCDYLREKKTLIILDNCEHLVDACAQMADRLLHAAPNARILASSREPLGIAGEVTYQVPSLQLPDLEHLPSVESLSQYEAIKLFIDRACAAVPTFTVTNDNAPALAQICHRLDGMPLAIELAAAKVRVLSLEQIAKRLDDRFRLLTGGSRTALERHQTLRAAIDWSYNLLSLPEQTLFRRLSVFVDGWTLEAAEYVCCDVASPGGTPFGEDIRSEDVLDLLEQLIHKSLVIAEEIGHESRYRMLETIRQYANEKLADAGERDALLDRHLDYFLQLAETAAPHLIRPEQLEWLAQLDADYENLRFALEWSLSKETAEPSLRLCAALGKFWHIRSYWLEGSKWMQSALAKPLEDASAAEKAARVKVLYQDAELAQEFGDLEHMKTSAELSLALAQEGSDKRDIAIARFFAGAALSRREDEHARLLMEQSLVEFRELNDVYWESRSYKWLTSIFTLQDKLNFSEYTMRNLELARKAGEKLNLAEALVDYAEWLYYFNRVKESKKHLEEADMLFKQVGSNTSSISFLLAEFAWLNGDYKEAKSFYVELQERYRLLGGKFFRSMVTASLGQLAMMEGNLDQSQTYLEEALETARDLEEYDFVMYRLAELGNTFYLRGNIERFKQRLREAVRLAKGRSRFPQSRFLVFMLYSICVESPENSARLMGVIDNSQREMENLMDPLFKRDYYDRAETYARKALGDEAFEAAFAEGQKMSLDNALDLALKTMEEM